MKELLCNNEKSIGRKELYSTSQNTLSYIYTFNWEEQREAGETNDGMRGGVFEEKKEQREKEGAFQSHLPMEYTLRLAACCGTRTRESVFLFVRMRIFRERVHACDPE